MGQGSEWSVEPEELSSLIKNRDAPDNDLETKYGGVKGVISKLQIDPKNGITEEEIGVRQIRYGKNELLEKPPRSWFSFYLDAIQDRTLVILCVAAVVSIGLGVGVPPPGESRSTGWIEGTAILIAVAIVSTVTSSNDWSKDKKFRKLNQEFENQKIVKVFRGGEPNEIPGNLPRGILRVSVESVVVGDVIILAGGDEIPADLLLIEADEISVNESSMTGEPEAVHKGDHDPYLLANTLVTRGTGRAVAIAVGIHSQWGKIKLTLEKEDVQTPLQAKLEDMAENIGKMGVVAAAFTLVALILKWTIQSYGINHEVWQWNQLGKLVEFVIIAITIIVVAVPEGLPLAVTLALAYSMLKMMKDHNLVRHLAACETMGGATQICSDKTGTLTENKMTGMHVLNHFQTEDDIRQINQEIQSLLHESVCVNSESYLVMKDGKEAFSGFATECALLIMSRNLGVSYQKIRETAVKARTWPFNSKSKRMSTLIKTDAGYRLHCKGASEVVLQLCSSILDAKSGKKIDIKEHLEELNKQIEDWASEGLRTLSVCYTDFPHDLDVPKPALRKKKVEGEPQEPEASTENECPLEKDLTLIGIIGIEDPIRNSVAICQHAGIKVRMLTGDNVLTAKKIAKIAGILSDNGLVMEGPKFRGLSHDEIDKIIPRLEVIARCTPDDKLILVQRLRELGEVVAVTGDGTNDAPILREADVGFAMGISGSNVAKDASDIILLDDNFASIEKAVLWGRNVYDSIRKFLQFQITVNIVAVGIAFLGAVTTGESPLTAIQLLWVNLIMDTMAALALATEPPTPDLMDRPPYGRNSPLITYRMWRNIIGQAIFQFTVLLFTLYGAQVLPFLDIRGNSVTDYVSLDVQADYHRTTIVFNTFVFCQLFNEINCRTLGDDLNVFKGITKNYIFLIILGVSVAVQILFVEVGYSFAQTAPLDIYQWIFCILTALLSLPLGVLLKFIPVPPEKSSKGPGSTPKDGDANLVIDIEPAPSPRPERTPQENWKLARDAILGQRKPGIVELVRKTHNRGNVNFGKNRITRNYTFMEY